MQNGNPTGNKTDVKEKSAAVKGMFDSIAGRYDFLNHFLSLGADIVWRKKAVRIIKELSEKKGLRNLNILDVCCGTGDLSFELSKLGSVCGLDFSTEMLKLFSEKLLNKHVFPNPVSPVLGDALNLPFSDETFDAVTSAFGVRNFGDLSAGLIEMNRVLKPGGIITILEFSNLKLPVFKKLFYWYFNKALPRIGRIVSGNEGAYSYLPESVRVFPDADAFAKTIEDAGFTNVTIKRHAFGICATHAGIKRNNN